MYDYCWAVCVIHVCMALSNVSDFNFLFVVPPVLGWSGRQKVS